jgi:hypothetical protein
MPSFHSSSSTPASRLTTVIATIPDIPLSEAVDLLYNLVPELTPSITFFGQRSVSHPKHPGTHDLNDLAYKYLHLGNNLSDTNASLSNRLTHYDLHTHFENLYKLTDQLFDEAAVPSLLRHCRQFSLACGCCVGFPWVVIPTEDRRNNAMYFSETVWDAIWGGRFERCGSKVGGGESMASAQREMLVEALGRGFDELGDVGLKKCMDL